MIITANAVKGCSIDLCNTNRTSKRSPACGIVLFRTFSAGGCGVQVVVGDGVMEGVEVEVVVSVGVAVGVWVGVGVMVEVSVGDGVSVGVSVGIGVGVSSTSTGPSPQLPPVMEYVKPSVVITTLSVATQMGYPSGTG